MPTTLGVNIDHVATLRQARRGHEPDVLHAAAVAEAAGADQITVHLREDRRHIQDADVRALRKAIRTRLNFEMGLADDIQALALELKPHMVTLVPERRHSLSSAFRVD
jgi:pyridoxine 5-phosphate synthase